MQQEFGKCRFTRAAFAHKGNVAALRDVEGNAFQDKLSGAVAEVQITDFNVAL